MGCSNSRLDDLPAVALCRERCRYIEESLRLTHSFAEAQFIYLESLKSFAPTLTSFFNRPHDSPAVKKNPPPSESSAVESESHIGFPPGPEEEGDEKVKSGLNLNEDETRRLIAHNFGGEFGGGLTSMKSPPPPPPPVTLGPGWDFLNLFETFEKYERIYSASNMGETLDKPKPDCKEEKRASSKDGEETTKTYEVKVVEKSSIKDDGATEKDANDEKTESETSPSVSETMDEIQAQFLRASESGNEVSRFLYHFRKPTANHDSFRLCIDESFGLSSRNLSSSLKKLVLWEKKLHCEVKAEEKLRLIYQKKFQELKYLDKDIAKAHKADSTRALLRELTTKLKIAFQIVDRIAIAINKTRDEELWPQIKELNQRLLPMWKTMLECHKSQHQKVIESKSLDAILSSEKLNEADVKAAIHLKLELQTWSLSFSNWVLTHRDCIKSLNDWLTRCLLYEPEEDSPDGPIPFSPGRLGAPAIFVIFDQWSQAVERLSETEVLGAVQGLVSRLEALLKEKNAEMQQIVISDKEIERKVKALEKIQKEKGSHGEIATIKCSNLKQGMVQIFAALENFMANSIQGYEELRVRIEEVCEKSQE